MLSEELTNEYHKLDTLQLTVIANNIAAQRSRTTAQDDVLRFVHGIIRSRETSGEEFNAEAEAVAAEALGNVDDGFKRRREWSAMHEETTALLQRMQAIHLDEYETTGERRTHRDVDDMRMVRDAFRTIVAKSGA